MNDVEPVSWCPRGGVTIPQNGFPHINTVHNMDRGKVTTFRVDQMSASQESQKRKDEHYHVAANGLKYIYDSFKPCKSTNRYSCLSANQVGSGDLYRGTQIKTSKHPPILRRVLTKKQLITSLVKTFSHNNPEGVVPTTNVSPVANLVAHSTTQAETSPKLPMYGAGIPKAPLRTEEIKRYSNHAVNQVPNPGLQNNSTTSQISTTTFAAKQSVSNGAQSLPKQQITGTNAKQFNNVTAKLREFVNQVTADYDMMQNPGGSDIDTANYDNRRTYDSMVVPNTKQDVSKRTVSKSISPKRQKIDGHNTINTNIGTGKSPISGKPIDSTIPMNIKQVASKRSSSKSISPNVNVAETPFTHIGSNLAAALTSTRLLAGKNATSSSRQKPISSPSKSFLTPKTLVTGRSINSASCDDVITSFAEYNNNVSKQTVSNSLSSSPNILQNSPGLSGLKSSKSPGTQEMQRKILNIDRYQPCDNRDDTCMSPEKDRDASDMNGRNSRGGKSRGSFRQSRSSSSNLPFERASRFFADVQDICFPLSSESPSPSTGSGEYSTGNSKIQWENIMDLFYKSDIDALLKESDKSKRNPTITVHHELRFDDGTAGKIIDSDDKFFYVLCDTKTSVKIQVIPRDEVVVDETETNEEIDTSPISSTSTSTSRSRSSSSKAKNKTSKNQTTNGKQGTSRQENHVSTDKSKKAKNLNENKNKENVSTSTSNSPSNIESTNNDIIYVKIELDENDNSVNSSTSNEVNSNEELLSGGGTNFSPTSNLNSKQGSTAHSEKTKSGLDMEKSINISSIDSRELNSNKTKPQFSRNKRLEQVISKLSDPVLPTSCRPVSPQTISKIDEIFSVQTHASFLTPEPSLQSELLEDSTNNVTVKPERIVDDNERQITSTGLEINGDTEFLTTSNFPTPEEATGSMNNRLENPINLSVVDATAATVHDNSIDSISQNKNITDINSLENVDSYEEEDLSRKRKLSNIDASKEVNDNDFVVDLIERKKLNIDETDVNKIGM